MLREGLAVALGAGLVLGIIAQADAGPRAKSPTVKIVTIAGCARYAPPFCTVLGSGGATYALHGASPPVPVNVGVTVTGVKAGDVSLCFGTPFTVLKWTRNKMRCPL